MHCFVGGARRTFGRVVTSPACLSGARYEDARGWDGRDDDRDRRSFDRRGYGDDYGRGGEDHLDRRRSYDSRGGADVGSWRSERNGYGFRDRDDGFPRGGRLSADREKTWRRREEPEPLKPVEPSPPPPRPPPSPPPSPPPPVRKPNCQLCRRTRSAYGAALTNTLLVNSLPAYGRFG